MESAQVARAHTQKSWLEATRSYVETAGEHVVHESGAGRVYASEEVELEVQVRKPRHRSSYRCR
jgi:hypothetical protein